LTVGIVGPVPAASSEIRVVLVEDVPQIGQYVRGLIAAARQLSLVDHITDGREALERIPQLRPDVVMIDALLQGKMKGLDLAAALRKAGLPLSIVVISVPQQPVEVDPRRGVDAVLQMPFTGYEMALLLQRTHDERRARISGLEPLVVSVYAPKGGVGKTTIAYNLAVALAQRVGRRTALVDGSLQFGDLRALMRVPTDAPSIFDLPTDRVGEADLAGVLWRDPSGVDILLAPPRAELADMISASDIRKVLSFLRRLYDAVVIDTSPSLNDATLALLDASDVVLHIVTYDHATIRNTVVAAEAFRALGYGPERLRYVVNRADAPGGMDPAVLDKALGRRPDFSLVSDGRLVVESNNQGVPFVLAAPDARISADVVQIATQLVGASEAPVPAGRGRG
jgi:pilus assembly protein CpaE